MELMRFPLENTHSTRGGQREGGGGEGGGGGGGGGGEGGRRGGRGGRVAVLKLSFFFAGNVSRGQEWYESRGLVSGRDGPRDSIGQM